MTSLVAAGAESNRGSNRPREFVEGLPANEGQALRVSDERGYETPEACALAGWTPEWHARVVETAFSSPDVAHVLVDTEPSHPMEVMCERRDGGWHEVGSSSAALPGEIPERVKRRLDRGMRRLRRRLGP